MHSFAQQLGDTIKKARLRLGLTQNQLAERINVDVRTIIHIENYRANPKMEVLYPLIRALQIDAREVFTPEILHDTPNLRQLRTVIDNCSESEAAALTSVVETVLNVMHSNHGLAIE